ncbi:MAG: hypothetical protein JWO09_1424 [Bacteroidetes bacterium]|nr:hypothetical protein [Bacteroidota bacterium]
MIWLHLNTMRTPAFFTLLLLATISYAQKPSSTDSLNGAGSINIYYGAKLFCNSFNNKLNTINEFEAGAPVQLLSMGYSGEIRTTRNTRCYGHLLYNQVIPQRIRVYDTISCMLSGYSFSLALGGALAKRSPHFRLMYYAGFNAGRLRLYEDVRRKNPFFSPV